jgi:hypothetical protein
LQGSREGVGDDELGFIECETDAKLDLIWFGKITYDDVLVVASRGARRPEGVGEG